MVDRSDAAGVETEVDALVPDAGDGLYPPSNIGSRSIWMRGGGCYCSFLNTDTGAIVGNRPAGRGLDRGSGIYFEVIPQPSGPDFGVFVMERHRHELLAAVEDDPPAGATTRGRRSAAGRGRSAGR